VHLQGRDQHIPRQIASHARVHHSVSVTEAPLRHTVFDRYNYNYMINKIAEKPNIVTLYVGNPMNIK
jgi:hypothetical protein